MGRLQDDPDYIALKKEIQALDPDRLDAFKDMLREQLDSEGFKSDFFSPNDVAKLLNVNPATVRLWIRTGTLEAKKIGPRKWFVPAAAVQALLDPGQGG